MINGITIEDLRRFSEEGDANATRLINEINRFSQQKAVELNNKIKSKIAEITTICARPDAVESRNSEYPLAIAELAHEWASIIDPDYDEIHTVEAE